MIFVGQLSAASAISCMIDKPTELATYDHSGHSIGSEDASHDMKEFTSMEYDCCSGSDSCSMAGCFMLAITSSLDIQSSSPIYQNIASRHLSPIHPSISSPYRPPILS